ncbi:MAG: 4Fe-4S dicluster domain-containing protein [Desulfobacterales bacterium]|nr:4Fe-4S dicluster domain-containing protein [Desulfobacterales bacterium]
MVVQVNPELCTGCGFCMRDCPVEAINIVKKKANIDAAKCTHCIVCFRVCPEKAVIATDNAPKGSVECDACPIKCQVPLEALGACQRYLNDGGILVRTTRVHTFEDVKDIVGPEPAENIRKPVITAIGSGTTYPCCKPAPYIVKEKRNDVDVVTVVTEVPLSYSSVLVKVDTDVHIGKEGSQILVGKRVVGMVETEQYGSKMLHIGGVNRLTGENGFVVARTIIDIANGKEVKLKIDKGSRLKIQVGTPPVIDGSLMAKMRVGCGSAVLGIFTPLLCQVADEVIVLDSHVTGLMSEHVAGGYAGIKPAGISLKFKKSTPGRYFGEHGQGWGGTCITKPEDIIDSVDMTIAKEGMTVLITETTGQNGAMFKIDSQGGLVSISLTDKANFALKTIGQSCEPSLVSAMYTAGSGGSARAGVTKFPIELTRAVHESRANLTIGGAPAFVMPGGGISFMVDVKKVKSGSFYWTPTPATICPVEYTMELKDYQAIGGHVEAMKPFKANEPFKASPGLQDGK